MGMAVFRLCVVMMVIHESSSICCNTSPCQESPQPEYVASGCAHDNKIGRTAEYHVLDGRNSRSNSQHCIIWNNATATVSWDYIVTSRFYNLYGTLSNSEAGHIGLALNFEDDGNYDYIYIRILTTFNCIQRGSMMSGQHTQIEERDCINRPLYKTCWFELSVKVSNGTGTFFIDGVVAHTFSPTFPTKSSAAVFVWNGFDNVVFFRDFKISLL